MPAIKVTLPFIAMAHAPVQEVLHEAVPVQVHHEAVPVQEVHHEAVPVQEVHHEAVPVQEVVHIEALPVSITPEAFLTGICSALIEVTKQSDITTEQVVAFFTQNMSENGILMITAAQMRAPMPAQVQVQGLGSVLVKAKTKAFSDKQKECQQTFASGAKARGAKWATANKDWWKAIGQKLEKKAGSKATLSGWHAYQMFGGDQTRVQAADLTTGIIPRPKK